MPRGDGTGPPGGGQGSMQGGFRKGRGRGTGAGSGGRCVCPACGAAIPHRRGVPCFQVACPKCGAKMIRE